MKKYLRITMNDGSVWSVLTEIIAKDRTNYYFKNYEYASESEAVKETEELFEDDFEIVDWASSNMNWKDVEASAVKVSDGSVDYQEGWINGEKECTDEVPK